MLDQVAAAFERKDYRAAAQILKRLLQESPHDPWVQFYLGRIQEVSGKLEAAEKIYRQLLRETSNPRLAVQTRQGIQRLEQLQQEKRQAAIASAKANPSNNEPGFLILETVNTDDKTRIAPGFARVVKLDAYTARLQLPSRGWRLYRTGTTAELQVLAQELQNVGVPAFCVSLPDLQKIQVFQVHHFQSVTSQPTVVCSNDANQLGSLSFDWSEVRDRIEGLLPIFEQVVDLDVRNKLQRKEQTQDYAHFCDLHLPGRRCILRLHDGSYQYHQGVDFSPEASATPDSNTTRIHWNHLVEFLHTQLAQVPLWSDFTPFAETAIDQTIHLKRLPSHINLFRQVESDWDPAFHLYSGAIFLKKQQTATS
jgi:tetratricopeptide (TPR) repeat protein